MLVSIIVPVYNVSKYLSDCINSIITQTYSNIEIILVNDGSTDNSGRMCESFAMKDDRISVYHINNAGVSNARNVGINHSNGEFLLFVDSDDWIEVNTVEISIKKICETKSDLLIYAMEIDRHKNDIIQSIDKKSIDKNIEVDIFDFKEYYSYLFEADYLSSSCTKLFKTSIIKEHNLYFSTELVIYEDLVFVLNYIQCSKKICAIRDVLYHYRMDVNIYIVNKRKTKNILRNIDIVANKFLSCAIFLGIKTPNDMENINKILFDLYIIVLHKIFVSDETSFRQRMIEIRRLVRNETLEKIVYNCPYYETGTKFFKILIWAIKYKFSLVIYFLYWRMYSYKK